MSREIGDLEPETRRMCVEFLAECEAAGLLVKITHTLRTMEEQAHLYAKGRTLPGPQVTKAKPGQSPHNYGMAFDVAFEGKTPYPKETDPRWEQLGKIGEMVGLKWGGRWKGFPDRPHFERPQWRSMAKTG